MQRAALVCLAFAHLEERGFVRCLRPNGIPVVRCRLFGARSPVLSPSSCEEEVLSSSESSASSPLRSPRTVARREDAETGSGRVGTSVPDTTKKRHHVISRSTKTTPHTTKDLIRMTCATDTDDDGVGGMEKSDERGRRGRGERGVDGLSIVILSL